VVLPFVVGDAFQVALGLFGVSGRCDYPIHGVEDTHGRVGLSASLVVGFRFHAVILRTATKAHRLGK
jgi:hypothetical protein